MSEQLLALIMSAAIGIVGILATFAVAVLTNRSAERLLIIQLQHDKTKQAIVDLNSKMIFSVVSAQRYYIGISEFLASIESAYLPEAVREWAGEKLQEFSSELVKTGGTERLEEPFLKYWRGFSSDATLKLMRFVAGRPSRQGFKLVKIKSAFRKIRKTFFGF